MPRLKSKGSTYSQKLGADEDVHERNGETIFLKSNDSSHTTSEHDSENKIENGVEDADTVINTKERAVLLVLDNSNRPLRYVENSLRARRRKNAMLKNAAEGSKPLTSHWQPKITVVEVVGEDEIDAESEAGDEADNESYHCRIASGRNREQCEYYGIASGRSSLMMGCFCCIQMVIMPLQHRTATEFVNLIYDAALGPCMDDQDDKKGLILMENGSPVHRSSAAKTGRESGRLQS
ncbi:unnamed protein product [Albugo candida]|uniref:Tc1-like transposase DDE domain-containing protein n=1 Tax=Albugo candida TaxID=65357 RepID=A0A024G4P6_9STRA|nr:unnamed protein product [Albugo candida]|eukprot:CCI41819.1 unnamed protein product [Albugo candida]